MIHASNFIICLNGQTTVIFFLEIQLSNSFLTLHVHCFIAEVQKLEPNGAMHVHLENGNKKEV